jgi:hypothetical protein
MEISRLVIDTITNNDKAHFDLKRCVVFEDPPLETKSLYIA